MILNKNDIINFKQELVFIWKYVSNMENYDMYSLYRSKNCQDYTYEDIYNLWKNEKNIQDNIPTIYVHIPFCEKICDYCVYHKILLVWKNKDIIIEEYIDYLIEQFKYYSPIFKWIKFQGLSVWWWTPSILSVSQLKRLFWKLFELFEFAPNVYKWIEFRPSSSDIEKIKCIKELWFTSIHFWVQSLDSVVLKNINREIDTEEIIKESIELAKKYKFGQIIVHLIAWLKWDTKEQFLYTIEKLIKFWATQISIFSIISSKNYLKKHYDWNREKLYNNKFYEYINWILEWIEVICNQKEIPVPEGIKNPFTNAWTIDVEKDSIPIYYCDIDRHLLWFWPSSRSNIDKTWFYTAKNWIIKNFKKDKIAFEWYTFSLEDNIKNYVMLQFRRENEISIKWFFNTFWKNIFDIFWKKLYFMEKLWIIKISWDLIRFLENNAKKRLIWVCFLYGKDYLWKN
jgi:coproporphyrinogen III oxidase-like Fe-S oxidoreductase